MYTFLCGMYNFDDTMFVTTFTFSLSVSPDPNSSWLAVGLQPGQMLKPDGFKLVYCYDWITRKLHHIFDAGIVIRDAVIPILCSCHEQHVLHMCHCKHVSLVDMSSGDGGLGVGVSTVFSPDGK